MKTAVVIGGGIGGLATAIRLSVKGFRVAVYEKNDDVGGKLTELNLNGFRFDMGPSLFTMPEYLEDLFKTAGKDLRDYLKYKKLDHSCHYFFPDGTDFTFYDDLLRLKDESNIKFSEDDLEAINTYLIQAEKLFRGSGKLFIEQSLNKVKTYFGFQALRALPQLINPLNLQTLHQKNVNHFKNPKLVQLFNRYATYNGSSPYKTPSMLAMISHLEHNIGTFFPEGGMYGIVAAMVALAKDCGVEIHTRAKVEKLNVKDHKVDSAVINGKVIRADIFVSNMDIALVYKKLLEDQTQFESEIIKQRSSSGLVFYWGINQNFEQLNLHNIFFSSDYRTEFEQIFDESIVPEYPTIYLNISSKCQPEDAPKGMENWFVMINVPACNSLSKMAINKVKRWILNKLTVTLNEDIETKIVAEQVLAPQDITERTLSYMGALYGTASNSISSSFTRHSNFSKDYANLYFVGGTVHPGGGIPLCLNSAKIVANSL